MPKPNSLRGLRGTAVLAGALLVGGVLFFGLGFAAGDRTLFTHDYFGSDVWNFHYPLKAFYASHLAQGELPLWCPHVGTGFPIHAEGQVGMLYPPNLLLFGLLPLSVAFNWSVLLHLVLAGLFTALFAWRLGAGPWGAALAGVAFAFSGFFIGHAKHGNMIAAAAWMPLVLLLVDSFCRERRLVTLAGLAVAAAMCLLAGHPQVAYMTALFAAFWAAGVLVGQVRRDGTRGHWRRGAGAVAGLVGAAVLAGLLAAPQLLPTFELTQLGPRKAGLSFDEATAWDMHPGYLATLVNPSVFGDPSHLEERLVRDAQSGEPALDSRTGQPIRRLEGFEQLGDHPAYYWEVVVYLGLLPLVLFLAGLALPATRRKLLGPLALAALAVALALGSHAGVARAFHTLVPGFDNFRFLSRHLLFFAFFVAVGSGVALSHVASGLRRRGSLWPAFVGGLAVTVAFLDLLGNLGSHNATVDVARWTRPPEVLSVLAQGSPDGSPQRMMTFDTESFAFQNAYYRAGGWDGDLSPYEPTRQLLAPNFNVLFGVDNLVFYYHLFPDRLRHAVEATLVPDPRTGRPAGVEPRLAGMLNVRHVVTPHPSLGVQLPELARLPGDTVRHPIFGEGPAYDIHVHENPGWLPRAIFVPRARVVASGTYDESMAAALAAVGAPDFDPRTEVVIEADERGAPTPQDAPGSDKDGRVVVAEYRPEEVRLAVDAPSSGWVVLSDTFYPGWDATVDGERATVLPANVVGRAVHVSEGRHEIVFTFTSASFRWGVVLLVFGLLAVALTAFLGRRRASVGV